MITRRPSSSCDAQSGRSNVDRRDQPQGLSPPQLGCHGRRPTADATVRHRGFSCCDRPHRSASISNRGPRDATLKRSAWTYRPRVNDSRIAPNPGRVRIGTVTGSYTPKAPVSWRTANAPRAKGHAVRRARRVRPAAPARRATPGSGHQTTRAFSGAHATIAPARCPLGRVRGSFSNSQYPSSEGTFHIIFAGIAANSPVDPGSDAMPISA